MRILHTSDWHLGRSLYGRKRYAEFTNFLEWLLETIQTQRIDTLLIAGDVFDTNTPGTRAQELYYKFLYQVAASCCRHVVVIAGNHDSPSFINAPKELLLALNVHVVGAMTDDLNSEVITLSHAGLPEAIICAVPYLRDKDIRIIEPGETIDDKNSKLIQGLKNHYAEVCKIAEIKQKAIKDASGVHVPIIGMGHLFTAGGKTTEGDGVRELYVGSLAHVHVDTFPTSIEYMALGHLHVPQVVSGRDNLRYCGSPIPMGFGEAKQTKQVIIVQLENQKVSIEEVIIPCFQKLVKIVGNLDQINQYLNELLESNTSVWLEVEYTGKDIITNLRHKIAEKVEGSAIEVLKIKNSRLNERVMGELLIEETLDDLKPEEVFKRCLDAYEIVDEERPILTHCYQEIIKQISDEESHED